MLEQLFEILDSVEKSLNNTDANSDAKKLFRKTSLAKYRELGVDVNVDLKTKLMTFAYTGKKKYFNENKEEFKRFFTKFFRVYIDMTVDINDIKMGKKHVLAFNLVEIKNETTN